MLNDNCLAMTDGVKNFLASRGLEQYYDMFMAKGFDSEEDLMNLTCDDLDIMYITDPLHRYKILHEAAKYETSQEYKLYEWLRVNGLDYYLINFVQSELTEFSEISRLNLPDEELYDELEITLPGHKKRFERAVQRLRKRRKGCEEAERPVAFGRWSKPECLRDAKYDFLCIDATISSTKPSSDNSVTLEFMVDSGSDVVTVREEVLRTLNLELIGPVQSRGVHASRRKDLYKAKMVIGDEELEIEVMSESYDSIGSRVIRHFRHYVTGSKHIWLKGDYADRLAPIPAQHHSIQSSPETLEAASLTITNVSTERPIPTEKKEPCSDKYISEHCKSSSTLSITPVYSDISNETKEVAMEMKKRKSEVLS